MKLKMDKKISQKELEEMGRKAIKDYFNSPEGWKFVLSLPSIKKYLKDVQERMFYGRSPW